MVKGAKVPDGVRSSGRMPTSLDELDGERDLVPAKSFDRAPTPDDVWVFSWAAAGGYGDPVERDPELVLEDVLAGRVTADWARRAYGVVVDVEAEYEGRPRPSGTRPPCAPPATSADCSSPTPRSR
jgi:hypothetical protein